MAFPASQKSSRVTSFFNTLTPTLTLTLTPALALALARILRPDPGVGSDADSDRARDHGSRQRDPRSKRERECYVRVATNRVYSCDSRGVPSVAEKSPGPHSRAPFSKHADRDSERARGPTLTLALTRERQGSHPRCGSHWRHRSFCEHHSKRSAVSMH